MGLVLIVEDDDAARDLLAEIIRVENHDVIPYASADGVLEAVVETRPDLAIVDINLPTEHGVSLAWRLRCHCPDLPILIASAVLDRWEEEDLADCGVDYVLAKPYNVSHLRNIVRQFMSEGRNAIHQETGA